jgi:hypothetical protein
MKSAIPIALILFLIIGCAKPERQFSADVFIRTQDGASLKCGLVTLYFIDQDTINSWQPTILTQLVNKVDKINMPFVAAERYLISVSNTMLQAKTKYDKSVNEYHKNLLAKGWLQELLPPAPNTPIPRPSLPDYPTLPIEPREPALGLRDPRDRWDADARIGRLNFTDPERPGVMLRAHPKTPMDVIWW